MGAMRGSLLLLAVVGLAACSEQRSEVPTAPAFGVKQSSGCSITTIQQLVSSEFTGATRTAIKNLVDALGQYRKASDASSATYVGYQILDSIGTAGRVQGSPKAGSALALQLLPCMTIGSATVPDSFVLALSSTGAWGVRGWSGSDAKPVQSNDGAWLVQPPGTLTWRGIASTAVSNLADSVKALFLAYGAPRSATGFTLDALTSTVFDWSSIPTTTFTPAVLVAECSEPLGYIQHNAVATAEVLGFVAVTCPDVVPLTSRRALGIGERLLAFFWPAVGHASRLRIGSAGGRGTFSPFGKINPVEIQLRYLTQPSKKGNAVNRFLSPTITLAGTSRGGTGIGNSVFMWLEAVNNNGVFVQVCNNWAYTDGSGVARFPRAYLNKPGGYTIVAKARTADGAPVLPLKAAVSTGLFNVKNSSAAPPDNGCQAANVFVPGGSLPPPPTSLVGP